MTTTAAIRVPRSCVPRLSQISAWLSALISPHDWPSIQTPVGCSPRVPLELEATAKHVALSIPSILEPYHRIQLLSSSPSVPTDASRFVHASNQCSMTNLHNFRSLGRPLRVFVLAGEPSGDVIGGRVMTAMNQQGSVKFEFRGVGG